MDYNDTSSKTMAYTLIQIYDNFLKTVQEGKPIYPVFSSKTKEKIMKLYKDSNEINNKIFHVFDGEMLDESDISNDDIRSFVTSWRQVFPIKSNSTVVCLEGDPYAIESAVFALLQGRDWALLRCWDELVGLDNSSSITIFGVPETLSTSAIKDITVSLSNHTEQSFWITKPFGLMTALTRDSLLYLIYKNLYYPKSLQGKTLYLNAFALNKKHYSDNHADVITRDECQIEQLEKMFIKHRELTVFSGHGHEDCLFLGKLSIFPTSLRNSSEQNPDIPLSAYARGVRDPDVIYTETFKTKYLFANTCCGLRISNGLFPNKYSVGLNFIEDSVAGYISTYMVKDNSEHDPLLFSRLIKEEGMKLGEAVRIINNLLFKDTNDFPCYLLVGDPEGQLENTEFNSVSGTKTYCEKNDENVLITAQSDGGYLIHIKLAHDDNKPSPHEYRYEIKEIYFNGSPIKDDIRYTFLENSFMLYSIRPMPAGRVDVRLKRVKKEMIASSLFEIDQYSKRLEHLQVLKLFEQKYKGLSEDINNSIRAIGPLYKPSQYSLRQAQKLNKLVTRIEDNYQRLQESIVKEYVNRVDKGSWAFTEVYSDDFLPISRQFLNCCCKTCGNQLLEKKIIHPVYRNLKRQLLICPRCGIIVDKPLSPFDISLSGSEKVRQGEQLTKIVTYKNQGNNVQLVTCGLGVERTKLATYPFEVRDAVQTKKVLPGETTTFNFEVKIPESCVAHSFYLKSFLLSNMEVACLHSMLFVLPKVGEKHV
ncbi:hypothetical protein [Geobacillus sp. Geo 8.1]